MKAAKEDKLIPDFLFAEEKTFVLIELPYCPENESLSKRFLQKLKQFTNNDINFTIKWNTKKIRNIFKLKNRNPHPSCVIYEGECSCKASYVGETKRIATVRFAEHNNPKLNSEPARHLKENPTHQFMWKIICSAPIKWRPRNNLEKLIITLKRPSINDQLESKELRLFRNGIT